MKRKIALFICGIFVSGIAFSQTLDDAIRQLESMDNGGSQNGNQNTNVQPQQNRNTVYSPDEDYTNQSNEFVDQIDNKKAPDGKGKSLVAGTTIKKQYFEKIKDSKGNFIKQRRVAPPYPESSENNVVWYKQVVRLIDLREKINQPLYFPINGYEGGQVNFTQAVMDGIYTGEITAYGTDTDNFTSKLTAQEVSERFGAGDQVRTEEKLDGTGDTTIVIKGSINWADVRELLVKEEWFFDKHYSQMFVRILGICPVLVYHKHITTEDGDDEIAGDVMRKKLFWIYYPDARNYLVNVMSPVSTYAANISFDDLLQRRKFSSKIISEGQTLEDRNIDTYTRTGLESMLESNRIENELLNKEHDFWEY